MKKILSILVILLLLLSVNSFASTNKPLENLSDGLDDMFYGGVEVPDCIDETHTKGTPAYPDCTGDTKDDVGRGIARVVGGLWKVATFWYPEEGE